MRSSVDDLCIGGAVERGTKRQHFPKHQTERIDVASIIDVASRRRFDLAGAITGTGGLVLLVDAISQAPQYGWGATRTIVLLAVSVAVLIAFLVIETRVKDPLMPFRICRWRPRRDTSCTCRRTFTSAPATMKRQ